MHRRLLTLLFTASLVLIALPAFADVTVFAGINTTPATRPAKGFAGGFGFLIVGFEFEYSDTNRERDEAAPSLTTGMGNVYAQTPFPVGRTQFYATIGAGVYREKLAGLQETNFGTNVGGGVTPIITVLPREDAGEAQPMAFCSSAAVMAILRGLACSATGIVNRSTPAW